MGTTLCAVRVVPGADGEGDEIAWINVGDSRVYLFRDDALIHRAILPMLEEIRKAIPTVVGIRSDVTMGRYHRAIHAVLILSGPESWQVCETCQGEGHKDGTCRTCKGCGYTIPSI